jgi:hypothetical protein
MDGAGLCNYLGAISRNYVNRISGNNKTLTRHGWAATRMRQDVPRMAPETFPGVLCVWAFKRSLRSSWGFTVVLIQSLRHRASFVRLSTFVTFGDGTEHGHDRQHGDIDQPSTLVN